MPFYEHLLHFVPFHFVLFNFILLNSTPFRSIPFYEIPFHYSIPLIYFYSIEFSCILWKSIPAHVHSIPLWHSNLFHSTLWNFMPFHAILWRSTPFHSISGMVGAGTISISDEVVWIPQPAFFVAPRSLSLRPIYFNGRGDFREHGQDSCPFPALKCSWLRWCSAAERAKRGESPQDGSKTQRVPHPSLGGG